MVNGTTNPVIYLTHKLWKYSQGNRGSVVLYFSMFIIANGIMFFEPLVIANLLNVIQTQGITSASMPSLLINLVLMVLLIVVFWIFHGPARVIENKNAFFSTSKLQKIFIGWRHGISHELAH